MTDREKVIKGLEYCMKNQHCSDCESCAYGGVTSVICNSLIKDALELLKEQSQIVRCKDCKHRDPEDKKCDCGHGIRWQLPREDDWFCADGKRKET